MTSWFWVGLGTGFYSAIWWYVGWTMGQEAKRREGTGR